MLLLQVYEVIELLINAFFYRRNLESTNKLNVAFKQ